MVACGRLTATSISVMLQPPCSFTYEMMISGLMGFLLVDFGFLLSFVGEELFVSSFLGSAIFLPLFFGIVLLSFFEIESFSIDKLLFMEFAALGLIDTTATS